MTQIAEALKANGLNPTALIYNTPTVYVYTGTYNEWPVIYKVLPMGQAHDYTVLEKECKTMQALSHPNIVRLYYYGWVQSITESLLVMVLELCDKDLGKDCKQRLTNGFAYQEVELWGIARELVKVLAWLQGQNIVHRDIKPDNIFLTQNILKLGDFGTSRQIIANTGLSTIAGTPLYLSPQLREAFFSQSPQVSHNAYKSDVYSLGMTMLVLSILNPVRVINSSQENVAAVLAGIPYSEQFKGVIGWMLTSREESRPDFLQLQQYFESLQAGQSDEIPPQSEDSSQVNPPNQHVPDPVQSRQSTSQAIPKASEQPSHPAASNPPATRKPIPTKSTEEEKTVHSRPPKNPPSTAVIPPPRSHSPNTSDLRLRGMPDQPINCVFCGKALFRSSLPADTVQLICDPFAHLCCSLPCFQALMRTPNPHCSICKSPIDEETSAFYWCPETPKSKCSRCMMAVLFLCLWVLTLLYQTFRRCCGKTVKLGSGLIKKRE